MVFLTVCAGALTVILMVGSIIFDNIVRDKFVGIKLVRIEFDFRHAPHDDIEE